jgi:hypothetical protein
MIGMDIHRTFGEVVIWEDGKLRHAGLVDMTRTALEGFGIRGKVFSKDESKHLLDGGARLRLQDNACDA